MFELFSAAGAEFMASVLHLNPNLVYPDIETTVKVVKLMSLYCPVVKAESKTSAATPVVPCFA